MISRAFFLLLMLAFVALAEAQQYRWVDKNGRVQYTDTPPPAAARDARRVSTTTGDGTPAGPLGPPVPFEVARLQKDFPVTFYSSPTCQKACDLFREALNKRGIPFNEVQVWDRDSNEELKRVSGANEVPVVVVGREVQRGFYPDAFDRILDSAGYPKTGAAPPRSQKAPAPPPGYVPPEGESAKPASTPATNTPPLKAGRYDPSTLEGPAQKPGPYGIPNEK
jgi:glutaredoxin